MDEARRQRLFEKVAQLVVENARNPPKQQVEYRQRGTTTLDFAAQPQQVAAKKPVQKTVPPTVQTASTREVPKLKPTNLDGVDVDAMLGPPPAKINIR